MEITKKARYEVRNKRTGLVVFATNYYSQACKHLTACRPTFDHEVVDTLIEVRQ